MGSNSTATLEKTLVHANERLSLIGPDTDSRRQADALGRFLKLETERLKMRHRAGGSGIEIAERRSYLVDLVINHASRFAAAGSVLDTCAVVAIGGYGRQELSPFSDIDVLFLHAGSQSKQFTAFVERLLYLMWDCGLSVGHSFRSVSECMEMARSDLHSRTALCSARVVIGPGHLLKRLNQELERKVYSDGKARNRFIDELKFDLEANHAKFGPSVCMQEPNLKEGPGGLRDLHSVVWAGQARFGSKTLEELLEHGHVTSAEFATARKAYEFLMLVRNESHFEAGRKIDKLTLDVQASLAEHLGYKRSKGLLASEILMRDYYRRATELYDFSQDFLRRIDGARQSGRKGRLIEKRVPGIETRTDGIYLVLKRQARPKTLPGGFTVVDNEIHYGGQVQDFLRRPALAIEAVDIAQNIAYGLGSSNSADPENGSAITFGSELKRDIASVLPAAGNRLSSSPEAKALFLRTFDRRGRVARAVRLMHECGILARFIPEFARITFLVQHDYYHRYTIDEHAIKAVEALDNLVTATDEKLLAISNVFEEVKNPSLLYLAALLHDIGKGRGSGHVERGARAVENISKRLGLDSETAETIVFLVGNHLLLSHLSQRRDISDDHLIDQVARVVRSVDRLNLLLLLTYADISAVGPGVWNQWKCSLLMELYSRTRSRLAPDEPAHSDHEHSLQNLPYSIEGESEVDRHLAMMPRRYLRATSPAEVELHVEMVSRLARELIAAHWRTLASQHCTEITVAAKDQPGLFAKIAGTLTANGLNIMSADIYTRSDGAVVDTFKVTEVGSRQPLRTERWARVEQNLIAAFSGEYNVRENVEKWASRQRVPARRGRHRQAHTSVRFDQTSSARATVIEVRSSDKPGLAFRVANRLAEMGLNIEFAKLATEKGHILDVFYLTGSEGQKLPDDMLQFVEAGILKALEGQTVERQEAGV